ncbi:alpha/beta hydrolase [Streptomyces sp. GC420]|uniref:alpha/beta hydrolase n=1 Tax=Streptomyces sp. GC420 TaxID=2697568 RepID=UPI0028BF4426|nr:alpha/beta hydrolase [Streptomyces sp. GC420]
MTAVTGTAGWAAGDTQRPVTGPPPGTAAWRADVETLGRPLPDPAGAAPAEVAAFFRTLTGPQWRRLAARHPTVVGNLDGAPVRLRYEANARALREERARQLRRAADPVGTAQDHRKARVRAERCAELMAGGRRILVFDPRGRGQVAAVYGDLEGAAHTAVVVPGSDIDLDTFDRAKDPLGTPAGMARALRSRAGEDTAVVAWAGYTTPIGVGVDAATGGLAEAGAGRLRGFLEGLDATVTGTPSVFCHSYGSVVCGLAAPHLGSGEATDLVVFGSPGMRADSVAGLRTGARVWAALARSDWIARVPNVEVAGLGHGTDPTEPAFGARRIPAARVHGHTGYFARGTDSLDAFAAITEGRLR